MHENFLDQFQRQQSQRGIQHKKIVVERGDGVIIIIGSDTKAKIYVFYSHVSDRKIGLNVQQCFELNA